MSVETKSQFVPPPTERQFAPPPATANNPIPFDPPPTSTYNQQTTFSGTPGGYTTQPTFDPPPTAPLNETTAPGNCSPAPAPHTTTVNNPAEPHKPFRGGASGSQKAAGAVKGAWGKFHGAGEIIRGNVNNFMHNAIGDTAAVEKDRAIIDKGMNEWRTGKFDARDVEPTTQTSHKAGEPHRAV
ncbi:hypothetical protein CAC42_5845 [Sphaceloma murrayae]|uniref:Uncharacterized protein n=1 Tax=Sphaceloma murrayae TaxID=2082308 RepID=A0A2K1QZB9_9PEZI|nr:hypothetical protein CAC42_5845 [Sphaceloma murrayae]